jgi:AhpD family alkylhydroperoxidase
MTPHQTAREAPDAPRISVRHSSPTLFRALHDLDVAVSEAVDPAVHELIKIRASQINGCEFCLDLHVNDARRRGESEERLDHLAAWREAPCYSDGERAVLALTETVTLVAETHVPDEVWDEAARTLTPQALGGVLMAIVAINGWNRVAIASRTPVDRPPVATRGSAP